MRPAKPTGFWRRTDGSAAVELAFVLPIAILLTIGAMYLSTMMFAAASLHFAVEDAARCQAVKTSVCTNATTTQTYAQSKYTGPTLAGISFVATNPSCGYQVVGSGNYTLKTGLRNISVPLSATACFPKLS